MGNDGDSILSLESLLRQGYGGRGRGGRGGSFVNVNVKVNGEILGPNHRPLQVTQDLASFWEKTYPGLKPELQRRYPKHEWR